MQTQSYTVMRAFRYANVDRRQGDHLELTPRQARPYLITGHLVVRTDKPAGRKKSAASAGTGDS